MVDPGSVGRDWLSGRRRWLVAVPAAVLVLLAVVYYAGLVAQPTAGVVDHDWGEVTDERTEVVTTVWVDNPNPVGLSPGGQMSAEYAVRLNDVPVAEGARRGVSVPPGNTTTRFRTVVDNDRLPEWWVAFLRDNETLRVDVDGTIRVRDGRPFTYPVERNRTMLTDSRPVLGSLSAAAARAEGTYATNVELDERVSDRLEEWGLGGDSSVRVGYEVERGWATLESVTPSETTVALRFRVHNPGDVPVPATPRGIRLTVAANDVTLFETADAPLSLRNASSDEMLAPGETREVTLAVTMDNEQVAPWFTSHVRQGERSDVSARLRLVFAHPLRDERIRLPTEGPVTYDCGFQTAVFVDDQEARTNCGSATGAS